MGCECGVALFRADKWGALTHAALFAIQHFTRKVLAIRSLKDILPIFLHTMEERMQFNIVVHILYSV